MIPIGIIPPRLSFRPGFCSIKVLLFLLADFLVLLEIADMDGDLGGVTV